MVRRMALENIYGEMVLHMKENGKIMRLLDVVYISGQMVEDILVIGKPM